MHDPIKRGENKSSYLHSLTSYPQVKFDQQEDDEEIILLVRAHPITFIPWIATAIVIFILPIIFNVFLTDLFSVLQILFINLFWYCLLASYIFMNILYWLFNVGLITNKRVIDVDYSLIVYKEVSEATIGDITDATARTAGFLGTMFNYGDVSVQTPGMNQNIEFLSIPEPDTVGSTINKMTANQ
ncbi:hypothetical protein KBC70_04000 [Candidatus Woesebacteria bacterium]|nr:hypothetical protein [Candidatus Woesebacteria bacterium]